MLQRVPTNERGDWGFALTAGIPWAPGVTPPTAAMRGGASSPASLEPPTVVPMIGMARKRVAVVPAMDGALPATMDAREAAWHLGISLGALYQRVSIRAIGIHDP